MIARQLMSRQLTHALGLHRPLMAASLIVAILGLAYANTFGNSWHYDDVHTITENPHIRTLEDPVGFFTDRTRFARDADKAMYRPLLVFTFAVNYAWSELATLSYHVVNLAIHMGCALLLWVLLAQLGRSTVLAIGGALLFGLHPLATEPVNYISARSESLSALLMLATLCLHLRARATGEGSISGWRVGSLVCFGASMLTKETGITALALVVLVDALREAIDWRRPWSHLRRHHAPYLILAAGYLFLQTGHVSEAVVDKPVRDGVTQAMTQAKALLYYLRLLLLPRGLNVQHQFFEGGPLSAVLFAALAVLSVAYVARNARWDVRFGLAWCVAVLSPTLVVPLFVLVNEHRLYLPLAGIIVAFTALLEARWHDRLLRRGAPALFIAGLLVIGVLTQSRNQVWTDEYTLWSDAAAKSPRPLVPVAYVHLGNYAKEHGALRESVGYYRRALEIAPDHVAARNNLGLVLQEVGQVEAAADAFRQLTIDRPDLAEGWYNLGNALQQLGMKAAAAGEGDTALARLTEARAAYRGVADSSYHRDLALNNMGVTFERAGRLDSAAFYYRSALQHAAAGDERPGAADAARNLARLQAGLDATGPDLLDAHRFTELEGLTQVLSEARRVSPEALFYLAVSRFYQGLYKESLEPNRRLVSEHPDYLLGYLQLGNVLETMGQPQEAHEVYRALLQRQGEGPMAQEARRRLGSVEDGRSR